LYIAFVISVLLRTVELGGTTVKHYFFTATQFRDFLM